MKYNNSDEWEKFKSEYAKISYLQESLEFEVEGEKQFIPSRTVFIKRKIIAGEGTSKELRCRERLAKQYGGTAAEWKKVAVKIESDKYVFDVHFYEKRGTKQYESKVKSLSERVLK